MDIVDELAPLATMKDREFIRKLIPDSAAPVLGVKTPQLKAVAARLIASGESEEFLSSEHRYVEEFLVHAFIIGRIKDYGVCLNKVNAFLPCIDNWMVCDQLSPKAFVGKEELIGEIERWLASNHTYTIRFGLVMLLKHFSGEKFRPEYLTLAANVPSAEYYVLMAKAWFFAEVVGKHPEFALPFLENLDKFTFNKAIQKATESFRVDPAVKERLREMRRNRAKTP